MYTHAHILDGRSTSKPLQMEWAACRGRTILPYLGDLSHACAYGHPVRLRSAAGRQWQLVWCRYSSSQQGALGVEGGIRCAGRQVVQENAVGACCAPVSCC